MKAKLILKEMLNVNYFLKILAILLFATYLYENMSTISPAKYLEILSPMPTFSNGYATIIIELVNKE